MHRKLWEWCAIAQSLQERSMLQAGRSGMGFAVGHEPLPSLFASLGVRVIATDFVSMEDGGAWGTTGQLATSLEEVHWPGLISKEDFASRVSFESVDMRNLPALDGQKLDFIWSSCALEHLGSLELGLRFILRSLAYLRPGGIAVHTTEYNVSSDDRTVEAGDTVLFRKRDIERLDRILRIRGCGLESPISTLGRRARSPL
jgi:SAM-dependent methyltransferase